MDTPEPKYRLQKLNVVFDSFKCAAKLNAAFGLVLKNVENGNCRFYCAHENRTLLEGSKLVATREDLTKIKNLLTNAGVTESCTKEPTNTKWKFYKLTNFLIFAAL